MSSISREYCLEDEPNGEKGGYLAALGGKLSSYRALSQKVLDRISERLAPSNASKGNSYRTLIRGNRSWAYCATIKRIRKSVHRN